MEKKRKNWGGLILVILLLYSCENEVVDSRIPFTGEFNFTTISNNRTMCYDSSSLCVNGWKNFNFDTTHITTNIELYSKNKLKIHFGNNVLGHRNDSTYNEIFYPEILPDGTLNFPEYPIGGHNRFEGKFIGYDTLKMNFHLGFLIGGYNVYGVTGIRNK